MASVLRRLLTGHWATVSQAFPRLASLQWGLGAPKRGLPQDAGDPHDTGGGKHQPHRHRTGPPARAPLAPRPGVGPAPGGGLRVRAPGLRQPLLAGQRAGRHMAARLCLLRAALLHPAVFQQRVRMSSGRVGSSPTAVQRHDVPVAAQALRMRRVLRWSGSMALLVAAPTMLASVALRAPNVLFLSGVYGTTGSLMVISSVINSS